MYNAGGVCDSLWSLETAQKARRLATVIQKNCFYTVIHNVSKYKPIIKILSSADWTATS